MSDVWKIYASNLQTIIDSMTLDEFVKQPRLIETMDGTARTLFAAEFYRRQMLVPGGVVVLGVRWGADLLTMVRLRSLFEHSNRLRPIIGFDTFEGHVGTSDEDGESDLVQPGHLAVSEGWAQILVEMLRSLAAHDDTPTDGVAGFVVGDVRETLPGFLADMPAFFASGVIVDLDLYGPTFESLMALTPRLVPGSVLWFDELNASNYPGESQAVRDWVAETGVELEWWRPPWAVHEVLATVLR